MKSGICPKCGADEIYSTSQQITATQQEIIVKTGSTSGARVRLVHYMCVQYQYSETYAADEKSVENVRKYWTPVTPHKTKRKNDETEK